MGEGGGQGGMDNGAGRGCKRRSHRGGGPAAGPELYARPSVGTGRPGRTGLPSRRPQQRLGEDLPCDATAQLRGQVAHRVLHEDLFAPVEAANSASSWRSGKAGGPVPVRPYVSWDSGTKRYAPVPVRPYLSRFNASLASADTPVPQAAAASAEDVGACFTLPPPLAGQGGTRGGHRAGDRAGSAAGTVSYRWRRRNGLRQQHRGVRGDWERGVRLRRERHLRRLRRERHLRRLRRERHLRRLRREPHLRRLRREPHLRRLRRERHLRSVQQRPRLRWRVAPLWRKGEVGGEPGCSCAAVWRSVPCSSCGQPVSMIT